MPVLSHLVWSSGTPGLVRWSSRPAWSYWRSWLAGGRAKVKRARWKVVSSWVGRGEGWVGALKALCEGALRQMSVPGGEQRLKGAMVVVVVFGGWAAIAVGCGVVAVAVVVVVVERRGRKMVRRWRVWGEKMDDSMTGTYNLGQSHVESSDGLAIRAKDGCTSQLRHGSFLNMMKAFYRSTSRRSGQPFRRRCGQHAACRDAVRG